jgi:alpha-methylacyl-CoA racemase
MDMQKWPNLKVKLTEIFKTKSRDEWCEIMEGTDVCFAPVLSFSEAKEHPHNIARGTFIEVDGVVQPAPAPRFSRTRPEVRMGAPEPGEHNESALKDWGFADEEIKILTKQEVI